MAKGEAITVDKTNYSRAEAQLTALTLLSAFKKKNPTPKPLYHKKVKIWECTKNHFEIEGAPQHPQIGLCKRKPSGDAGSAQQTGHRGWEDLSRGDAGVGVRNELPAPPPWGPFHIHLAAR